MHVLRDVEVLGEVYNFLAGESGWLWVEGGVSSEHFVQNNSDGPVVHGLGVAFLLENFRGDVVGSPNCAECQLSSTGRLLLLLLLLRILLQLLFQWMIFRLLRTLIIFAQAKIGQFDMSLSINQNIIGFEITMDVIDFVDALDGQDQLGDVELGFMLREDVFFHKQGHEIAPLKVLHYEVEMVSVLERVM